MCLVHGEKNEDTLPVGVMKSAARQDHQETRSEKNPCLTYSGTVGGGKYPDMGGISLCA